MKNNLSLVSIIICTYKRKKWLENLLESISRQSIIPDEILIVDASKETIEYSLPIELNIKIIESDRMQLTYQKNIGLDQARGDIIFFLDDDLLLEKNYVEETLKVFNNDALKKIGAISGYITNEWGDRSVEPGLIMKVAKLFNLYDGEYYPGSVSNSGIFIELNKMQPFSGIKPVDFVPGGCTAFRKEVFNQFRPPLEINQYGGEDKAFSRMIARDWEMFVCGNAKCEHFSAPGGARQTDYSETKSTVKFNLYIQNNYGLVNNNTTRLRLYYLLISARLYFISFIMFISIIKIKKGSKWFKRGSGYLAGILMVE